MKMELEESSHDLEETLRKGGRRILCYQENG